jgi:hypothetical protein
MYLRDLERFVGGVGRNAWGKRRENAIARHGSAVAFAKLSPGVKGRR